jgi:Flp pilus assembly protein TadG
VKLANGLHFFRDENGASLVELAVMLPLFMLLLFGSVDLGRAYFLVTEVAGAAHAGAEYGVQDPTDTTGIEAAATDDAPNVANLTVGAPTYGCECSDGTAFTANCTSAPTTCSHNVVYRVSVTVSATYRPVFPWPLLPSSYSLSSTAVMRSGTS